VLNLPFSDVDALAKKIPMGMKLREAIKKEPVLKSSYETDDIYRNLFEISFKLEGLNRHASTHAAGVVVSDAALVNYVPLYESNGEISTQFSMGSLEAIGLMKIDFLGLITLEVLEETLRNIREAGEEAPDLDGIALDDRKTYKLLSRGEGRGIFQLESGGMRELLSRLKPDNFNDLIAILALYRPGPLGKGMVESYIQRKQGKEKVVHLHPSIARILEDTYGVILYQEQVMQIANELAGFTMNEADSLRKAMGKKKPEIMEEFRGKFVKQAVERNVAEDTASKIFGLIAEFAGYGFNKSHSTAYAMISYQTAYLKANYPVQFMAALLTNEANNQDKIADYIAECERMNIKMLPPKVNKSYGRFTVEDGKKGGIRFGLTAVKNVGAKAIRSIVSERSKDGPYKSLFDFCERVNLRDCNKQQIDSLIKCGAFDSTGARRAQLAAVLDEAMESGARLQRDRKAGQKTFFEAFMENSPKTAAVLPDVPEWPESQLLAHEKDMLGFYLTSHPLAKHGQLLRGYSTATTATLSQVHDNHTVTVGGLLTKVEVRTSRRGNRFVSITLEDLDGSCDAVVLGDIGRFEKLLKRDTVVFLQGTVNTVRDRPSIRINRVIPLSEAPRALQTHLIINIPEGPEMEEQLVKLKKVLEKYPGTSKVLMTFSAGNGAKVKIRLPSAIAVEVGKRLISKIEVLFGPEHVTYSARGLST
jgi:DNA polymerase-3 subunit alpha